MPDPVGAAWAGAAPRQAAAELPVMAAPEISNTATYEPLPNPVRESWPPPPEPIGITAATYQPLPEISTPDIGPAEPEPPPAAAEPTPLPEPPAKPSTGNEERFAALVKSSRSSSDAPEFSGPGLRAGLFTTIILLIGIGAGVWTARFHIMQAWPPSIRLFDAINMMIANLSAHH